MIRAGFVSSSPKWDWKRQFPGRSAVWDDVEFHFENIENCDILFIYDGVVETVARGGVPTVFIASEPSGIKTYLPQFLSQFDLVLTTDQATRHPNVRLRHCGTNWHAGAWDAASSLKRIGMGVDDFRGFYPQKTKQISIVSSNKANTQGHRDRLEFVYRVKAYFGNEIDFFGRGINDFADKLDVLSEYRYHIAIENSVAAHYWTEKLADPLLTLTYPIYHGSSNAHTYLPEAAFARINIHDPDASIATVRTLMESDIAENALPEMEEARRIILEDENMFNILAKIARNDLSALKKQLKKTADIKPERDFRSRFQKLRHSLNKRMVRIPGLF